MGAAARALALAGVWVSPAVLLALPALVLADGTLGLWGGLPLAGAAVLVAIVLASPWGGLPVSMPAGLTDLVRHRWPDGRWAVFPLALASGATAFLFLWAQLAAGRELMQAFGGPPWAAVALFAAALLLCGSSLAIRRRVAAAGGALALLALVAPLGAVLGATDPHWPRVFREVGSRPHLVFSGDGRWATGGWPVRGPGPQLTVEAPETQRVMLLGRSAVRIQRWEGGRSRVLVRADTPLTLRPGDRLVVPDGFPIRFRAGRMIPGAPRSGADWVDPPARQADWRAVAGLGVTLLVGGLGLAPVHAALATGRSGGDRVAQAAAALALVGFAATALWGLYAAWLVPEVYVGGVAGIEAYELPASVRALGPAGSALRGLALAGLGAGGMAAGLAALSALGRALAPRTAEVHRISEVVTVTGAVLLAGFLAVATPSRSWSVLLAAFGLAASACAPAAVLACWRERLDARGLAAGASLGLVVYGLLAAVDTWGLGSIPEGSSLSWFQAWPALVATPVNALAVWVLSAGPGASPRSLLPPGFSDLHT